MNGDTGIRHLDTFLEPGNREGLFTRIRTEFVDQFGEHEGGGPDRQIAVQLALVWRVKGEDGFEVWMDHTVTTVWWRRL